MSDKFSKDNCVGEYPALWRIRFKFRQQIRQSVPGTGETECVGHQVADRQFDVVTVTPEMAKLTFVEHCPVFAGDLIAGSVQEPEFVAYVDAITLTQRSYGGHFS